jgi:hypothetical protein
MKKLFTHPAVSIFDRIPFQLTDQLVLMECYSSGGVLSGPRRCQVSARATQRRGAAREGNHSAFTPPLRRRRRCLSRASRASRTSRRPRVPPPGDRSPRPAERRRHRRPDLQPFFHHRADVVAPVHLALRRARRSPRRRSPRPRTRPWRRRNPRSKSRSARSRRSRARSRSSGSTRTASRRLRI